MIRLREWREERGLSLRQLAKLSGVHYVSLAKIEARLIDPRLSTLLKLCKALDIGIAELVGAGKLPKKGGR
jgi:transcriptional regulator with XRE-family HTH domain